MPRVALLSDELVNKIAAGEVVERPASVVKELCENAIDASATRIRVSVEGGGCSVIRILDDGIGMGREDALLALQRHATSKLQDLEGLFHIESMGFRGEALPSIASVSRFTLTTAERGAAVGTRLYVEGGRPAEVADAAPQEGTRVVVEDLFFNVPARRKYLKQQQTELRHVSDVVARLALAHPEVGFVLEHEGRELFASAPRVPLAERVGAALGQEVVPHLLEISERRLGLSVEGLVASPEHTLPNARGLYTFVNRRYVRDRALNFAIQRAYSPLLAMGRQPVGVVLIDMDPHAVDVNVHPQKLEVRFVDPRSVTDAVHTAVARAVKSTPWLGKSGGAGQGAAATPDYALAVHQFLARAGAASSGAPGGPFPGTRGPGASLTDDGAHFGPFVGVGEPSRAPAFGEARPDRSEAPAPGYFSALRLLGEIRQRLWVLEGPGGSLVAVDAHAAHERLLAGRLWQRVREGRGGAQGGGLFTHRVELPQSLLTRVMDRRPALERLGVEVEPFGGDSLSLALEDATWERVDWVAALSALVETLPKGDLPPDPRGVLEGGVATLACHLAQREARAHSQEEVRTLLRQLDSTDFTARCLHPKLVTLEAPFLTLVGAG
jgi:DNA mismatch repair protein MutL